MERFIKNDKLIRKGNSKSHLKNETRLTENKQNINKHDNFNVIYLLDSSMKGNGYGFAVATSVNKHMYGKLRRMKTPKVNLHKHGKTVI